MNRSKAAASLNWKCTAMDCIGLGCITRLKKREDVLCRDEDL